MTGETEGRVTAVSTTHKFRVEAFDYASTRLYYGNDWTPPSISDDETVVTRAELAEMLETRRIPPSVQRRMKETT